MTIAQLFLPIFLVTAIFASVSLLMIRYGYVHSPFHPSEPPAEETTVEELSDQDQAANE